MFRVFHSFLYYRIQPTDIVVRLGPYRLAEHNFLEKSVSVMDVFVRGRFRTEKNKERSRKLRHNTAIIRLKEPVDFDHFTRPICLTGALDSIRSEITGSRKVHPHRLFSAKYKNG